MELDTDNSLSGRLMCSENSVSRTVDLVSDVKTNVHLSTHTCNTYPDIQHSAPASPSRFYKRHKHTTRRICHSTKYHQRASPTVAPVDFQCSRVVEEDMGRRPSPPIPSKSTSTRLLQRRCPLLLSCSGVPPQLATSGVGCACRFALQTSIPFAKTDSDPCRF
jgi:hypothetical protein